MPGTDWIWDSKDWEEYSWELEAVWAGDQFYLVGTHDIYRPSTHSLEIAAPKICRPGTSEPTEFDYFEYDGKLTTVLPLTDGTWFLTHLVNGRWIKGRQIVLPGPRRVWQVDESTQNRTLLPLTSAQPDRFYSDNGYAPYEVLQVFSMNGDYRLYFTDKEQFHGFRNGLEFADDQTGIASAVVPCNSRPEATGWTMVSDHNTQYRKVGFGSDGHSYTWARHIERQHLIYKQSPVRCSENLAKAYRPHWQSSDEVIADIKNQKTYLITNHHDLDRLKIRRIEADRIDPPHIVIDESFSRFLSRWCQFLGGLILAWLAQFVILSVGFHWIAADQLPEQPLASRPCGKLASFGRRTTAALIDLSLLPALAVAIFQMGLIDEQATKFLTPDKLVEWELSVEKSVRNSLTLLEIGGSILDVVDEFHLDERIESEIYYLIQESRLIALAVFSFVVVQLLIEAYTGLTLGKWLTGIRTVRTSNRPCGLLRSVVRKFLYCVDIPFGLTPLPALLSMSLSERWQRLGDRVADTMVIRTKPPPGESAKGG